MNCEIKKLKDENKALRKENHDFRNRMQVLLMSACPKCSSMIMDGIRTNTDIEQFTVEIKQECDCAGRKAV